MITLTKDKIIFTNHYNPDCDKFVQKEVPELWPYLEDVVTLSDDFTLMDLFNYIEKDKEAFDVIFNSCLGHFPLQAYLDDIVKERSKDDDDELDYLEVYRCAERWEWGSIDMYLGFHGISIKEDIPYAVEFTPLSDLKHLPLRLNNDFEIGEVLKEGNSYQYHVYTKGKVDISVYELISAVLFEVSFCGVPEQRDERMDELSKRAKEIPEEFKDHPERFTKWSGEDKDGG